MAAGVGRIATSGPLSSAYIADLAMSEISRFLFKLQTWPEVKIKQVSFNKYDPSRETWGQCQVVASRFLAQEAE